MDITFTCVESIQVEPCSVKLVVTVENPENFNKDRVPTATLTLTEIDTAVAAEFMPGNQYKLTSEDVTPEAPEIDNELPEEPKPEIDNELPPVEVVEPETEEKPKTELKTDKKK